MDDQFRRLRNWGPAITACILLIAVVSYAVGVGHIQVQVQSAMPTPDVTEAPLPGQTATVRSTVTLGSSGQAIEFLTPVTPPPLLGVKAFSDMSTITPDPITAYLTPFPTPTP
jgi:hypothetical protein